MVFYEENAAWNIPPTKIRVINNLLRMRADFSKRAGDWLQQEREHLLDRFRTNKWTVPSDVENPVSAPPPDRRLLRKTLARGFLVKIPKYILEEAATIGRVKIPPTDDRAALFRLAKFNQDWEKYLEK